MPLIIPTQSVPVQTIGVQLNNQDCSINLYTAGPLINGYYGPFNAMFLDLFVANTTIITGVLCLNLNLIVRSLYLGFSGDLAFLDNQGNSDPFYQQLGTRFSLCYLFPSDLPKSLYPEES